MTSIHWFRRDLRLSDNPAFNEACVSGEVLPVVLIDPNLWPTWGAPKQAYLIDSLTALNESLNGNLVIKHGAAVDVIPELAKQFGVTSVHYASDFSEHGIERDAEVGKRLAAAGVEFVATGSAYAVAPGRVTKEDGTSYKVYTPFYKVWLKHGWRAPVAAPKTLPKFVGSEISDGLPTRPDVNGVLIPPAGEKAALARWAWFKKNALADYADNRNRADLDGTSKLSTALKWGEVHPRTLLADLGESQGEEVYRKEIAWREFYADVLFNRQDTVEGYFNPLYAQMKYDTGAKADAKFAAWCEGRTGYPYVDAGMRQLRAEGWMHNRVRMVVASFLVKDLHIEWQLGARFFMQWLLDGDYASNSHGWQWTAGCGTDASPYYRVFNPIGQGLKFDPNGDYVRKYVPELAHIPDGSIHEPWKVLGGLDHGYPEPIVDHATERLEALDRLAQLPKAAQKLPNPRET